MVALEYYKAHPEHVSALVFGGSVFDWPAYACEAEAWTKQMSDSGQRAIAQWKKDGIDTTRSFKAATDEFYAKICLATSDSSRSRRQAFVRRIVKGKRL